MGKWQDNYRMAQCDGARQTLLCTIHKQTNTQFNFICQNDELRVCMCTNVHTFLMDEMKTSLLSVHGDPLMLR